MTVARSDDEPKLRRGRIGRERHVGDEWFVGCQVLALLEQRLTVPHQQNRHVGNVGGYGDPHPCSAVVEPQAGGGIEVGVGCWADLLDRIPVLAE